MIRRFGKGFTLVEMLVAIMVIGLLTTVSIAQFQSGRQDDALRLAAIRVSDSFRTAQSSALSGTLEQYQNASAYGVRIFKTAADVSCQDGSTTVNEGLVLFADANNNGLYDAATDTIIRCVSLDVDKAHSIVFDSIQEVKTADDSVISSANVTASFRRPTSIAYIDNDTVMKKITITLKNNKNNHTKQVVFDRISGRIDFEY